MFQINQQTKQAVPLTKVSFSELKLSERHDLQEWIVNNPAILGEDLLVIQKEFAGFSDTNERLDLLALDEQRRLVIIENKLDDSGRDVVWQALKYASYCATLTDTEIYEIFQQYLGAGISAVDKITEFYDEERENIRLNPTGSDQRIVLVAANFRKEVTSTVLWLRNHGVNITCIKVTPYIDDEKLYLDTEQILPVRDIEDYQIRLTVKKQKEAISAKEDITRHSLRRKFWEQALPELRSKTGIFMNVSPTTDQWVTGASGHGGIGFTPVILKGGARAELFIGTNDRDRNKHIFRMLFNQKSEIEHEFGGKIDWQQLSEKKGCRICVHYNEYGLYDSEEHWADIIDFITGNITKLMNVFKERLDKVMKEIG